METTGIADLVMPTALVTGLGPVATLY